MPRHGGTSAKYGPRFEDRWTAHVAFNVLRERAQWIQIEPPGAELGIEFRIQYTERLEYHQVKRQKTGDAEWSISALKRTGVLRTFWERLRDPHAHCVFASTYSVGVLDELIDRACKGPWSAFKRDYLSTITWRTAFEELLRAWGDVDEQEAFQALTRMRVEAISEPLLTFMNTIEAETTLEGDLSGAVPVLVDVLRDKINMTLTPFDLWAALEPLGYRPGPWRGSPRVVVQVSDINRLYRATREGAFIAGKLLKRPEARQLHAAIESHRIVMVTGVAGSGKSGLLLQFSDDLKDLGVPFLALRLDSVTPTLRAERVGEELGLAMSPPSALAVVAQGKPAVLIIDQLDVVSATSGRNIQFFDCLHEILGLALSCENIRIVLACRSFDLENDARLRQLTKKSSSNVTVNIGLLLPEQVTSVLEELGYSATSLTAAQAQILGVPLHLALLTEVARSTTERHLDFRTAHDLYLEFWKCKRREVEEASGAPDAWMAIMCKLVDHMSEQQTLSARIGVVDDRASVAAAMASAHVLISDGKQYAFFHETFFDYVFARCFLSRGQTLPKLLEMDQFLFRRAQVRQILTHEREDNPEQYAKDLHYLLTDVSVRFHIQESVVSWLGQVIPKDVEWRELEPLLRNRDAPLWERAWTTLRSSAWFRYADQRGAIERWLRADDGDADVCVWVLSAVCNAEPDRVAMLLREHAHRSDKWVQRIISVLRRAELWRSRCLFDLCVDMLERDAFEPVREHAMGVWDVSHGLQEKEPEWACELLGHYLRNRLRAATVAQVRNPFDAPQIIPRTLGGGSN